MTDIREKKLATVDMYDRRIQEITEMTGPYGRAVLSWFPGITFPGFWGWDVYLDEPPSGYKRRDWTARSHTAVVEMLSTGGMPSRM